MCLWRTVLLSTSKSGRFVFHNNYWRNTTTFFFWSLSPSLWFSLHPITTADGLRLRTASMLRFPWMQPWRQITVNGRNTKAPRHWEEKRRVQKWKAKTKQSLHRQKVQDALKIYIYLKWHFYYGWETLYGGTHALFVLCNLKFWSLIKDSIKIVHLQ